MSKKRTEDFPLFSFLTANMVVKAVYFSSNCMKGKLEMKKVKSLKKNPSWFGNMIKLGWIITGISDSLLPSIIPTNPAISNHNKHPWAQQLSAVLLTLSANQKMLSMFSLSFDSICLECESTSWALLFHIHAEAQWHLVLYFQKGLNSADRHPFRPRCKVNGLHLCDIRHHNMLSYGSKPSQRPAKPHSHDGGSQKSRKNKWQS